MSTEPVPDSASGSWREHAVARSLDPARARAEKRVQRFLDAALDLMNTSADREFTVQEVVERSGQSLRSFYQHFAGKHELLFALFEESVRSTADTLRERVSREENAIDRLHAFVIGYYDICRPPRPPAMVEFAQQLLTTQPVEASRVFSPLVSLFQELLADAAQVGAIRSDLDHGRIAGVALQAIMFNMFAATISAPSERAQGAAGEQLWDLILNGVGGAPS